MPKRGALRIPGSVPSRGSAEGRAASRVGSSNSREDFIRRQKERLSRGLGGGKPAAGSIGKRTITGSPSVFSKRPKKF